MYQGNQNGGYPQDVTSLYQPLLLIFGEENFASAEQITPQLVQLNIFGEIFSERGFFVRSDVRKKHSIRKIEDSLNKILEVFAFTFKYKNSEAARSGFIAQQLQKVFPEIVHTEVDGSLSIDSLALIPIIVESLKTLNEMLNETKAENKQKIKEAQEAVQNALKIVQQQQLNQFEFSLTLGPLKVVVPITVICLLAALFCCIFLPDLPFILLGLTLTAICCIISIAKMPSHLKVVDTKKFSKLFQSPEVLQKTLKKSFSKRSLLEVKRRFEGWLEQNEMTNYQKSVCLCYFILVNINLLSIALSFIFGETLIRFCGIYLGILLLFWGCSVKYFFDISFMRLFYILTLICVTATLSCVILIKKQPTLECSLYGFENHNTTIALPPHQESFDFLLSTQLPWNCMNPHLMFSKHLPTKSPTGSALAMTVQASEVPHNFKTQVFLVCSAFIKFDCGTFVFL
ncbi:hypothetical protein EIN_405200 [Entamoeba invadens IP1]|uniref:Peptidase S74 domain-containing protein n=1 Tax=Entamoeba invadens IP1 TaxID=370355 RepID=A0A0A1UAA9_ENTIV|nr:hypothetical protein EIN_405200 [Entamoeba invadens IP1]ELP90106.1 hypothetical protein EIN_405200 [Entamoeba invadens IP1]|eukprot:XP_004256877.1 hypothetical protein EIN_405200 [Entamoeba invadens IP1]